MTDANETPTGRRGPGLRVVGAVAFLGIVLGLATLGTCGWSRINTPDPQTKGDEPGVKEPTVGGLALFHNWPKGMKPDAAIVLSGQTFGFLQPCGCSRPQMGGLERRATFLNTLKAKGWPVVGFDLGDLYPQKSLVPEQAKMKYKLTMNALRDMGYVAVGVGQSEFTAGVDNVYAEYALQKEQPPYMLAGNLRGAGNPPISREDRFPKIPGGSRPLIGLAEAMNVNGVEVAVLGLAGKTLAAEAKKLDPSIDFADNGEVLKGALAALAALPKKPQINVLLYQGTADEAKLLATAWPQFQVILCQADDPEPPQFPATANDGKTLIVQVGHKGRYVGVVGAFKKAGGGFDLKYQLVPLTEDYITPGSEEAARKANAVLPLLESYSEQVRDRGLLTKPAKTQHPSQIQEPKLNLSYIGSERCQNCHAAQFTKWKDTPHSHALDALEKVAKRPSLRNFDAECVQCHVIGLHYKTGYEDQKLTPQLAHVGCESCHGPGSGHATNDKDAKLILLQSPWKQQPGDRLPDIATIKKIGALPALERGKIALQPAEQRIINVVSSMCAKCHDHENDPNFDFFTYWPKVNHTFKK